jgi:hypothetical protein
LKAAENEAKVIFNSKLAKKVEKQTKKFEAELLQMQHTFQQ